MPQWSREAYADNFSLTIAFVVNLRNHIEVHLNAFCQPGVHVDPIQFRMDFLIDGFRSNDHRRHKFEHIYDSQLAISTSHGLSVFILKIRFIWIFLVYWKSVVYVLSSSVRIDVRHIVFIFGFVRSGYSSALSFPFLLLAHHWSLLMWSYIFLNAFPYSNSHI